MRAMRKVMLAAAGGGGGGGGGGGSANGFTQRYTFTIDHTQCGTADSTDFPVCVRLTDAALKSTGNSGSVTSASGYDIVFTSDLGLTTILDFEVVSWSASTGELLAWVRIPTLSHTANTVFYLGSGKSSITTDQSNRTGVWDSNSKAVYHFGKTAGFSYAADVRLDSTANANVLSNGSSALATIAGQVGVALDVTNSLEVLSATNAASLQCLSAVTVSAWAVPPDNTVDRFAVARGNSAPLRNYALVMLSTGVAAFHFTQGGVNKVAFGTSTLSTSLFTHLVGTYDGANIRIWVNGVNEGTTVCTGSADNPSADLFIGCQDYAFGARGPWAGYVDEVRLSNTGRSSSWVTAEYNNQKSSSTFYAVT